MTFATDEIRALYDIAWSNAEQIGTNSDAQPGDVQFEKDVKNLIRWRKDEAPYPFGDPPIPESGDLGFLDVGLPITTIGNGYRVIDARGFVNDTGGYRYRSLGVIERISVHHSVTREPFTKDDELALLTEIGNFHVNNRGWFGYAYHWSIAGSGRTYYTGDMSTIRYVVGATNPTNIAICLLGNFMESEPSRAALESLRLLIGEIQFTLGQAIPYLPHCGTPLAEPTSCPGATYLAWLPGLAG